MSKNINDVISEQFSAPKEYEEEEQDKAVLEDDDDLKTTEMLEVGKIQKMQSIPMNKNWKGKIVSKKEAFGYSDDEMSEDEEPYSSNESNEKKMSEDDENDENDENESENNEEEEGNGEIKENEEEDEADQMIKQTTEMKTIAKPVSQIKQEDVVNQIKLYNTAMDIRVKLQPIVTCVNALPLHTDLNRLTEQNTKLKAEMDKLTVSLLNLMKQIGGLCETLDANRGLIWENASDYKEKIIKNQANRNARNLADLEKWNSKTTILQISKISNTGKTVNQQVKGVMRDKERLHRRSQQLRDNKIYLNDDLISSDQIYDDGDFYEQTIKDAMEYGLNRFTRDAKFTQKPKKIQKKDRVNTNIIFPKLENFKSPIEYKEENYGVDRPLLLANLFK